MDRYAVVDTSQAPLVHVRVVGSPTEENYAQHLEELAAAFRGLDRFGMLFDTGDLTVFPAKFREALNRWIEETEPEFKGRWLCSAFVIKSRIIRGVLMAVYWLNEPYYAYKLCATESEARDWVSEQLGLVQASGEQA